MEFSQKPSVVDWLLAHAVRVEYAENGLFFLFYYSLCSYYAYYKAKFILNFAKLVASDKYSKICQVYLCTKFYLIAINRCHIFAKIKYDASELILDYSQLELF